jgi:hypothetical protein
MELVTAERLKVCVLGKVRLPNFTAKIRAERRCYNSD